MAIWLISFLAISIATLGVANQKAQKAVKEQKHTKSTRRNPMSLWMLGITCFAVVMVVLIITSSLQCKQNSEIVSECVVNGEQNITIYYDNVKDEYFIYETNWWHPIKMFERRLIEKETATKIIEAVSDIEEAVSTIEDVYKSSIK